MKKIQKIIADIIPRHSVIPLLVAVSFNFFVYGISKIIAGNWYHYNIESPLDKMIPFLPFSVVIYLGCYLFWVVNYILIARQDKRGVCEFFSGDFISRVVCFFFYLAFPTTNVRPQLEQEGIWNNIVGVLYSVDAADNLFPSIHCLVSWFCYIGLRGRKDIPVWYRRASCVMAILVFISTLTTKQHVIVDVFGGVFLAEICFYLGKKQVIWGTYQKFLDKINRKIFSEEERS